MGSFWSSRSFVRAGGYRPVGSNLRGKMRVDGRRMFSIASNWEKASDDERTTVKALVSRLVGYTCLMACDLNNGSVDLYVCAADAPGVVSDWLELQPNGAIGVVFDQYPDPDAAAVYDVCDRCEDYNEENDVEFASDSESEGSKDSNQE